MRKTNRDINPSKLSILTNNIQECDLCDLLHDGITHIYIYIYIYLIGNNRYIFNQQCDFSQKTAGLSRLSQQNNLNNPTNLYQLHSDTYPFLILSAVQQKTWRAAGESPKLAMEVQLQFSSGWF